MNVTCVMRKRITNPEDFDALQHNTESRMQGAGFDSIKFKMVYDPDDVQNGDKAFTSPE